MRSVLKSFTTDSLFDASAALLKHLRIEFSSETTTNISIANYYRELTSGPLPKALDEALSKVESAYYIGAIDTETLKGGNATHSFGDKLEDDYSSMLVFSIDVAQSHKLTRTEIATLTRGLNRMMNSVPVIVIFRSGHHISLATCERTSYVKAGMDGEKLGKVSLLRDINCLNPHRGHLDILSALGDKAYSSFEDLYAHWMEVFSVDVLTKKFYTELSEWFAWVIDSGVVRFPNDITTHLDDQKFNNESTIRLITRLIFVWFLKQKNLIPEEFFDEQRIRESFIDNFNPDSTDPDIYDLGQSKYYRLILQNLFFAMLNRPIKAEGKDTADNRRFATDQRYQGKSADYNINNLLRYKSEFKVGGADYLLALANTNVPYLHGGLFECLDDKDSRIYYDGFSENKASLSQLCFPDYFFFCDGRDVDLSGWYDDKKKSAVRVRGILNILKSYNFTIEENTPLDQEVSLDPELLGKVFENLLASYNPETNASARKQTGSFYTPRPIVKFMVDESLIAHLQRHCPQFSDETLRSIFSETADIALSKEQRRDIISALYNCKVLDPACGSGAFPMGILQQMVAVLRRLDPTNEIWHELIMERAVEKSRLADATYEVDEELNARREDIRQAFDRHVNDPDYARKLYLIENCIYGVDIQPIATQISKLRFFISLVAEQKPTNDPLSNFGIRPLPNLEAKFVSANTLLPLERDNNIMLSGAGLTNLKQKLADAHHRLFITRRNATKKKIQESIENLRSEYAQELEMMGAISEDGASKLSKWDLFDQNHAADFFDSEWMFGVADGFDIVIGNPPFVQLQKATGRIAYDKKGKAYDEKIGDPYATKNYKSFTKMGDMYCLFYEQGVNLLRPQGVLCYITSNKWMRAGYGEKIRGYFAKEINPILLIDFGGIQVFESATVDTNILLLSKEANQHQTKSTIIGKEFKDSLMDLSDFVQQSVSVSDFSVSDSWVILSPIEQSIKRKIEAVGTPLKDWDIQINYGIKTGCNDAFIISSEKREEILANCATEDERLRTDELIRPILRGRDIKRYSYTWAEKWVILAYYGSYKILQSEYPAIYRHLLEYEDRLKARGQVRYTSSGKTRTGADFPGQHHWLELDNNPGPRYLDFFFQPKIVYMEIQTDNPEEGYPFPCFSFDEKKSVVLNTGYIMSSETVDTKYVLGILNSSVGRFITKMYVSQLQSRQYRMLAQFVEKFPIPLPREPFYSDIVSYIDHILSGDGAYEENLNSCVYNLFAFSHKEIDAIRAFQ